MRIGQVAPGVRTGQPPAAPLRRPRARPVRQSPGDTPRPDEAAARHARPGPGLETFAEPPIDLASPARAAATARAFSAGNGYLAGLIVDRLV